MNSNTRFGTSLETPSAQAQAASSTAHALTRARKHQPVGCVCTIGFFVLACCFETRSIICIHIYIYLFIKYRQSPGIAFISTCCSPGSWHHHSAGGKAAAHHHMIYMYISPQTHGTWRNAGRRSRARTNMTPPLRGRPSKHGLQPRPPTGQAPGMSGWAAVAITPALTLCSQPTRSLDRRAPDAAYTYTAAGRRSPPRCSRGGPTQPLASAAMPRRSASMLCRRTSCGSRRPGRPAVRDCGWTGAKGLRGGGGGPAAFGCMWRRRRRAMCGDCMSSAIIRVVLTADPGLSSILLSRNGRRGVFNCCCCRCCCGDKDCCWRCDPVASWRW